MIFFSKKKKKDSPSPRSPFTDETTLGNILMQMRVITRAQLLTAIGRKAQHDDMLLGALLKELGFCSDAQVAKALTLQAKMRSGDVGDAAMEMMELRLESFGAREDQLTEAIQKRNEEVRGHGEQAGVWLVPFSPETMKS